MDLREGQGLNDNFQFISDFTLKNEPEWSVSRFIFLKKVEIAAHTNDDKQSQDQTNIQISYLY